VLKAEASMKRILAFLNQKSEIPSGEVRLSTFENVEFNDVTFTYPETGITALQHVSFEVKKGETIAFIGHTGSGKSSLMQLMLKAYTPTSGNIQINHSNLNDLDTVDYRKHFRVVPQDVFLFSDTIENNIRFGKEDATEAEIHNAARIADLEETIQSFELKYNTLLGERGINLSGGQKQRLSIARAIIGNPDVLLLDDCLSALDTQTDERIVSALKRERQGKTNIIISHRISSIHHADRIYVLNNGSIAEVGSHEELLAAKGLYFELNEKQRLETN
jgi:ATP-binding cassette, subfamily B, multidrug efflux pump